MRKNSQLAAARRVALKMGRRLRCSSVTHRLRYAPSSRLAGGPFWTQRSPRDLGDGTLGSCQLPTFMQIGFITLFDNSRRLFWVLSSPKFSGSLP
jgi:hypothetical protein